MTMKEVKPTVSKWRQRLNEANHGPKVWVDVPGETDVLLGKQRDAFNHIGNRTFRSLIHANWERYNNAKGRCDRTAIVVSIVKLLREEKRVRFLKKDRETQRWFIVNDSVAREKVGHAIRDAINFRRHHDRKIAEGIPTGGKEPPSTASSSRKLKKKRTMKSDDSEIPSREAVAEILGALKTSTNGPNVISRTESLSSPVKTLPSTVEQAAMMGAFNVWASQKLEQTS